MNNDIVSVDLKLIDSSIDIIKEQCQKRMQTNNKQLKETLEKLTSEEWISNENTEFIAKMNIYQEKLDVIEAFYGQVCKDLQKIKIEMEEQMNKTPSVHYYE